MPAKPQCLPWHHFFDETEVSLPAVIAANEPGLLVMLMLCVQQIYFSLLLWFLPWKASWMK